MRLFEDDLYWERINDGDLQAFEIFKRHYTFKERKPGKNSNRFSGPGERIILIGKDRKALFVWRKEKFRSDNQVGLNCCVFRNESNHLSSELILQAERIAHMYYPGIRLFTFVNPRKIKSINPGCCYKKAGWKQCGISKERKLLILEKI